MVVGRADSSFFRDEQRGVLAQLMSEGVAVRLLDSAAKASDPAQSLTLAELNRRLDTEVWADLAPGRSSGRPRSRS